MALAPGVQGSRSHRGIGDLCWDPSKQQENVEAVTKDNLTTDVRGQIRYTISKSHLYPYFFGVESPLEHVMGFFISIMRERLANFVAPNQGESNLNWAIVFL